MELFCVKSCWFPLYLKLPDVVPQSILGEKRSRFSTSSGHVHVTVLHQIHLGTMTTTKLSFIVRSTKTCLLHVLTHKKLTWDQGLCSNQHENYHYMSCLSFVNIFIKLQERLWSWRAKKTFDTQNFHPYIALTMAAGRSWSLEDWITLGAKSAITAKVNNHLVTICSQGFITFFRVWWLTQIFTLVFSYVSYVPLLCPS